jgi:PAS domain S-box-containing protein
MATAAEKATGVNDPDHRSLERRTPGRPDRRSIAPGNAAATGRRAADFPLFGARQLRQLERSPCPMRIFDHATLRYVAVNDAALELYGYTRAEFLKLTVRATRQRGDDASLFAALAERTGYLTHWGARRQVRRSGEVFLADVVTQDVRFEGRAARLSLTIDISERVRMQELLRQREQLFAALVVHSPDIISRLDRGFRHLYVSPAVTAATSRPPEDFIGRTISEVGMPPALVAQWEEVLDRAFVTASEQSIECTYEGPDGPRHYESRLVPEKRAEGGVETMLVITRDITHRKLMEDALRSSEQQRLAHAVHQRDALVREVHHRINNHLQGIAGLLRDKARNAPAAAKTLDAAVAQLQSVAVVYGFQSELAESGVPLSRVLEAICASAEGLGPARITRGFSADRGEVRLAEAEAVPVAVALNELVFNAIEHGARCDGTPGIEVGLREKRNGADIRIVNRGRLPAPFDYSRGIGTGTGLDLVKTLLGPSGSRLAFSARDGLVRVQLSLGPPLVAGSTMETKQASSARGRSR